MKATKKPVTIEFFTFDELKEIYLDDYPFTVNGKLLFNDIEAIDNENDETPIAFDITTLEGTMRMTDKDVLIVGVKGEIYPCKKDIFQETYEINVRQPGELVRVQKRENLNKVFVLDHPERIGNGCHQYAIDYQGAVDPRADETIHYINFQDGPRKLETSKHGVLDSDLLEIVLHRMNGFQDGKFATRENALVITHIELALMYLNKRVEDRIERNVLGTNNE